MLALAPLTAPPALAHAATGLPGAAHREFPQRTPSGAAAPARARGVGRTGVGTAVVGGPELAGRGVIVHYPAPGARRLPSVHASSYVIADAGTGQVLAAKDPHGHFLPASTLKVLTADALMPVLKPDATVVTSGLAADVTPNKVGLVKGHAYQVSDLFQALLLISANDAAIALAQATGVLRQGRGPDERRGAPAPGRRHRGQAAERAERQGPAHLRLRPGPVRPAGADHAGVHADRGHPHRDVPAAPPPLDRVVQPEHHAQHLPGRPRRQDRLDDGVRDHVHRLGPAERPHADRDPHALRPAHRDEGRRQAAELGLRPGWEGHPGRHAGPAAARRSGRRGVRAPGGRRRPGRPRTTQQRRAAPRSPGHRRPEARRASRTSGWLR